MYLVLWKDSNPECESRKPFGRAWWNKTVENKTVSIILRNIVILVASKCQFFMQNQRDFVKKASFENKIDFSIN